MKNSRKVWFITFSLFAIGYCAYSWHDWYWYWYWYGGLKDPLVSVHLEQEFENYTNDELLNILIQERFSPRTNAASDVLLSRENTDDIFDELFENKKFSYITSDKERKVYSFLYQKLEQDTFDEQQAYILRILAKLGYEEMIPEAAKFTARGQYDEALEAVQYFKGNPAARKILEQISAQNNNPFAADRAKKMLEIK